jgi:hypothetical protein
MVLLVLVLLLLMLEDHHRVVLVGRNVIKAKPDAEFQCVPGVYRAL